MQRYFAVRFKFNGQVTLLELIEIAERIPEYYLGTVYQKLVIANFEKSTRQDIIKYRRRVRGRSIYDLSDPLLVGETGPSADSYILLKPLIIGDSGLRHVSIDYFESPDCYLYARCYRNISGELIFWENELGVELDEPLIIKTTGSCVTFSLFCEKMSSALVDDSGIWGEPDFLEFPGHNLDFSV